MFYNTKNNNIKIEQSNMDYVSFGVGNQEYLQDIYVDIDDMDNLQEKMDILNQHLSEYGYHVQIESEDTYCALAYFLMLKQK